MGAFHKAATPQVTRQGVRRRFQAPRADRPRARPARPGDRRAPLTVHLRPSWQRQDHHRRDDRRLLPGDIAIPHAISVDRDIIRVFDPMNHEVADHADAARTLEFAPADSRWVRCRRPVVTVGGELTLDSLELGYHPGQRFLSRPAPDGRKRRRARHRRLRPAALFAHRNPEPLDRPAGEPHRLSGPSDRPEVRDAVRDPDCLRNKPQPARSARRVVPSPHSLQGVRGIARPATISSTSSSDVARSAASASTARWSRPDHQRARSAPRSSFAAASRAT